MSEIILKLPKRRNRVRIISNPDNLDEIFRKKTEPIITEVPDIQTDIIEEEPEVVLKEVKTQFIHKFVLNDRNKPIQINLSKLPKPSISIEDARIEVQSAYDNGFKDGQESTIAIYESEISHYKDMILSIESVIENLKKSYLKEIKKFEDKLIDTSITVSEYVLEKEISLDNNSVINTVKRVLEELQDEKVFQIQMHPNDYQTLLKLKSKLFTNQAFAKSVELIIDSKVEEGGAIIISSAGTIDARISSQLNKIKHTLIESLAIKEEVDFNSLKDEYENLEKDDLDGWNLNI